MHPKTCCMQRAQTPLHTLIIAALEQASSRCSRPRKAPRTQSESTRTPLHRKCKPQPSNEQRRQGNRVSSSRQALTHDRLLMCKLALGQPSRELRPGLVELVGPAAHDEALVQQLASDDRHVVFESVDFRAVRGVVLRDAPTRDDPPVRVHEIESLVEHLAADVVEICAQQPRVSS